MKAGAVRCGDGDFLINGSGHRGQNEKAYQYKLCPGCSGGSVRAGGFQILTDSPQAAYDILTPHFMKTILSAGVFAGVRTYLYFGDTQVHIAVHNKKNFFEIGKGAELADLPRMRARFRSELKYITNIMDLLIQNTDLSQAPKGCQYKKTK